MMNEQMMPEPSPNIPETNPVPEPEYNPEPEPLEDYDAPPMPDGKPSEIALDDEGEVKFSEDFFEGGTENQPDLEKPRYYTQEELQNIPFEQWQFERMPEELRDYARIVGSQLQARRAQQQIQQRPGNPPEFTAPHQYTPKELSEEAQRIAVQRLGLEDPDDFDDYEPEHRAALNMAMNELVQQNYAAQSNYNRIAREYQNLQQFNAGIASRPDYKEFDNWFGNKLKELKIAPDALDKVREFQERVLGKSFNGFATSKRSQVLRKLKTALRLHDNQTVRECIKEYEKLAGKKKDGSKNTQGLKTSMKSMNPLFGLSDDEQKKFMRWLDNEDKVYLRRADKYFHRLADKYIK